jgi:glycosyltransferase involved in cell wall biosynthesis
MRWIGQRSALARERNAAMLLTICIATYNRATQLPRTLESIVPQLQEFDDVELLIVDGNSTDDTEAVVAQACAACAKIRYLKLAEKGGVDKDFDIAVCNSSATYCWLFTDDDLLMSGAVRAVRDAVLGGADLVVVNAEVCDFDLRTALTPNALKIERDVRGDFFGGGRDAFFRKCAHYITFIGAIVIRRALWVAAPNERFYGTRFIHVGVLSTLPEGTRTHVLAEPRIRIRLGNAEWSGIAFKVWTELWPNLIWSFDCLSESCKRAICAREPWKSAKNLLWYRALGSYSTREYAQQVRSKPNSPYKIAAAVVSRLPQMLVRLAFVAYARLKRDRIQLYCLGDGGRSKNSWLSEN